MLKGIDQRLSAEIVHVLMLMGHGDDLVICDVNHPAATIAAETTYGRLIDMAGCDIPTGGFSHSDSKNRKPRQPLR